MTERFRIATSVAVCLALAACGGAGDSATTATPITAAPAVASATATFKGEVWADNWFQFYLGNTLIATDTVAITTERSFNSETFSFSGTYPLELNFIIKDYKADDSGLEYIGTAQQQIGDGGFIAQITDTSTGKVVAVSSSAWKCKAIHKAPLNKACVHDASPITTCGFTSVEEPAGWKNAGFDTSGWESATEYTTTAVGVKQGYYDITWNSAAKPIWTSDLLSDNTLLCKATVTGN